MKSRITCIAAALALAGLAPITAHATDGYFSHGYGNTAKGMGGASIAVTQDAFGGANNPATMVWVGRRVDVGIDWFSPRREVERSGSVGGMLDFSADSESNYFFIPEFAYNHMLSKDLSLGVTVYGNGGMNTDFPGGQLNCSALGAYPVANGLCGDGNLGVDLMQLIIAPTLSWRFHPNHSVGIAPLFAYQRFKAYGIQLFGMLSQSPGDVTNRGYEDSTGFGVRVGYYGKINDMFSIGATYASKMSMSELDAYKGLFAENGGFDIPEHYGFGVAIHPAPQWLIAVDYLRINYNDVKSVGNPSSNQAPLGSANGPGFGWQNVDVWKIGVQYELNDKWTLRAGYNHSDNPIRSQDVTFNILAPGVIKDHYTAGFTYKLDRDSQLTMAYTYAAENSVSGPSFFNGFMPGGGGNEKIQMHQNQLGIAWARKF
jgi:long-chain fatty acid transport protein